MKHTRFAQESAAQAQVEAREKHTSDMRPHGSDRFGNPCECEGCEEWDAQSRAEALRGKPPTRQDKAWDIAEQIYWAVEHGERLRAEQLLDRWADERTPIS